MNDLTKKIMKVGVENCMFLVPMKPVRTMLFVSYTSSEDPDVIVPCRIVEDRYKVEENYKITLKSDLELFGKEHYYISDLNMMINDGRIEFFIKENLDY